MMGHPVYFDYNATVPVRSDVANAISEALTLGGNASSVHSVGRQARRMVEEAREQIALLVGARPAGIIFTSGGTEANNLAFFGLGDCKIITAEFEHPSIYNTANNASSYEVIK